MSHLPVLVVLFPLCGALLCPFISRFFHRGGKRVAMWCLLAALVCAVLQLIQVISGGAPIHYWLGGWKPPLGIEFVIDGVNAPIIVLVAAIAFLTSLYSSPFERGEKNTWVHTAGYYSMVSFLGVGLLGMSSTGDVFNLYVFMEITAISGYGLIAAGPGKGPIAAFRYLMLGTVGASMYLLGVGFLYAATGTLNMADLALKLLELDDSPLIIIAAACMIVGFGIKMALFPLHTWQPAAHSYAHEGADPMIAGIMIKIPAYAMLRFFFCVFNEQSKVMGFFFQLIGIMAVCGVLFGSLKALRYDTFNKILAYSSIGQVGYIAMGFAIGNYYGLVGAVLHIISHAFMKAGLFYTSGALKYRYGIHEVNDMGQVYRDMPMTATTMVVCALSMIGLPPFPGFFSKWYLAMGAIEKGQYLYVAVLILSSLLSAIYFFRVFEKMFMDKRSKLVEKKRELMSGKNLHIVKDYHGELPWQMLVTLGVVTLTIISLGLFHYYLVDGVLKTTLLEVFLI